MGRLGPGAHLPSERALGERLAISRITLRRALRELADRELIEPSAGRGWQVAQQRLDEPANALVSFSALARARGLEPSARVLRALVRPSTLDEAERLRVAPGVELLDLERLRLLDGVAILVSETLVSLTRAPGIESVDFGAVSLFDALDDAGVAVTRADCVVEAVPVDARRAELLGLGTGEPVMRVLETLVGADGSPVALGLAVYRGDRYRLETTLLRQGPPQR